MQVVVPCASRLPRVADVALGGRGRAAAMDQPAGRADRPVSLVIARVRFTFTSSVV